MLKSWPAQAGLSKALLSRAHSEGPGNAVAGGGVGAARPHDVLLTKEPERKA